MGNKTGYLRNLLSLINKPNTPDNKLLMLAGKSDFILDYPFSERAIDNIRNIVKLTDEGKDYSKFVRKVKTRVVFEKGPSSENKPNDDHVVFRDYLQKSFVHERIEIINQNLKVLKVSRNIRYKVLKIFYSYYNGIQDSILFNFYLDFPIFISNLNKFIKKEVERITSLFSENEASNIIVSYMKVDTIESILLNYIEIYDEGFTVRSLDSYQHEQVSDIDLDLNSSVQQIISLFNTLAIELGNTFYDKNNFGPVVNLNLKNTVADIESINYDIYHLSSPEFVLFTFVKEILNKYISIAMSKPETGAEYEQVIYLFNKQLENDKFLSDLYMANMIQFNYIFIDAIRLIHTCNFDYELFTYWFWTYNFQNSSLFNTVGTFNEDYLKQEMFRILFLGKLFKFDISTIKCPTIELSSNWDKYFSIMILKLDNFFNSIERRDLINSIKALTIRASSLFLKNYISVNKELSGFFVEQANRASEYISEIRSSNEKTKPLYKEIKNAAENRVNYHYFHYDSFSTKIKEGKPLPFDEKANIIHVEALIFSYLKLLYELNDKKLSILHRSWENSDALTNFNNEKRKNLYLVDQLGGVFFISREKMKEYYLIRNALLHTLWNYSMIRKKDIYF